MRISCLIDNRAEAGFRAEHGLSLWIEANGKKLLFDAGSSGAFAENAMKLGIDLSEADAAVLSHGHYDHSGGMERFFELNGKAVLYVRAGALREHWSLSTGSKRYIGLSEKLKESDRLVELDGDAELWPGFLLFGAGDEHELVSEANLVLLGPDGKTRDDFGHEQNLIICENGKTALIAGCAHRGIVNILSRCIQLNGSAPDVVVGGFHLAIPGTDGVDEPLTNAVASRLLEHPGTTYYTGHCTGDGPFRLLSARMKQALHGFAAGDVIEL